MSPDIVQETRIKTIPKKKKYKKAKWLYEEALQIAKKRRESESESCSAVSNSMQPHGLYSPWNSPGQNTGAGSCSLLQGSSQPRDWTQVSHIAGRFFTVWGSRQACPTLINTSKYTHFIGWKPETSILLKFSFYTKISENKTKLERYINWRTTSLFYHYLGAEFREGNGTPL